MNQALLSRISQRAAFKTLPIGVILAFCMGYLMTNFKIMLLMSLYALPGLILLVLYTRVFAGFFGRQIYEKNRNPLIIGFLYALTILFFAIVSSALLYVIFRSEMSFVDYLLGPIYWVFIVGTIPCIALGYIYAHFFTREIPDHPIKLKVTTALILVVIFVGIYALVFGAYRMFNKAVPERVLIPRGYEGAVFIIYDQPNGAEEFNGRNKIYRIPTSGILYSKFKESQGFDPERQIYLYDGANTISFKEAQKNQEGFEYSYLPGQYYNKAGCNFKYHSLYVGPAAKKFKDTYVAEDYLNNLVKRKKIDCELIGKINQ